MKWRIKEASNSVLGFQMNCFFFFSFFSSFFFELSLIFHFRYKVGSSMLQVLSWTWNLEQRLLLGVTYHQAIVWFTGRRRLPQKFGDKSSVLCVNCPIPTLLWLQLLAFMLFPLEHFLKNGKTLPENRCGHTFYHFLYSHSLPNYSDLLFNLFNQVGIKLWDRRPHFWRIAVAEQNNIFWQRMEMKWMWQHWKVYTRPTMMLQSCMTSV